MSAPLNFAFIECPSCKNKLPPNAMRCQFCGADVSRVPRPANTGPVKKHYSEFDTPKWISALYYVLSGWWIFSGILMVIMTQLDVMTRKPSKLEQMMEISTKGTYMIGDYVLIFVGVLTFAIGIGLACKVRWVREAMNWIAGLTILGNLLHVVRDFILIFGLGPIGVLFVLYDVFNIVVAVAMIWLIGETD